MNKIRIPKKSIHKVFRPVGKVIRSNRELLCMSTEGVFFIIRFSADALPHLRIEPHFRLVLKTDFRLVGTSYGVPCCELGYEDVYIPSQVVIKEGKVKCKCAA